MSVIRCPECGNRLKTNYCDMCMKTVPFPGLQNKASNWQARKYESPYEKEHTCIDFDQVDTPKRNHRKSVFTTTANTSKRKTTDQKKKKITTIAVVMAVISLISSLGSFFEEVSEEFVQPEPDTFAEAYASDYVPGSGVDALEFSSIIPAQIYHTEDISITVGSSGSYYDDFAILVEVVNNTDQDITVSTNMLSVNGYMLSSSGMHVDIPKGKSVQDYLVLYFYDLEAAGIKQVANVQFGLDIWDTEEYTDIDSVELISLETDVAEGFVQPVDDVGKELYNDGKVRLLMRAIEMDSYGDCNITFFAQNLSDKMVSISAPTIHINGEECSGILWNTLRPNTCAVDDAYLYELEELDIKDLSQMEEIKLNLHIEYMEDWYVEETINETVIIDVNE